MKTVEPYLPLLEKHKLFASITHEDLISLLTCMNPLIRHYQKGETIGRPGQELLSLPLLLSGEVSIYKEEEFVEIKESDNNSDDYNAIIHKEKDDSPTLMAKFSSGHLFGEIGALSGQHKWPAYAIATEECEVIFLPLSHIVSICSKGCCSHRGLLNNLLALMAERTILLIQRVEYLSLTGIRSRIIRFLRDEKRKSGSATFHCPMNREELAQFLGITRPSLSREMSKMKNEGLIDYYKNTIRLLVD